MKKIMLTSALILTAVSVTAMTQNVEAATDTTNAITKFTLKPGSGDNNIKILNASDLVFTPENIGETTVYSDSNASVITIDEFSGSAPGWTLTAKDSALKMNNTAQTPLLGATIQFDAPTFNKLSGTSEAPVSGANGVLNANDDASNAAVVIAKAAPGKGYGQWEIKHAKAKLGIPAGNLAGDYAGTMTYTITSGAPADNA